MGALNILLVDDDRNLATTLSYGLLKALGNIHSVVVCFNSSEALSMLTTQAFDLVISDFNLPGMSGLELLTKIRQDHRRTILILATAYGTEALEEKVHRLGMGYITKPFELSSLVQLIRGSGRDGENGDGTEAASPRLIAKLSTQPGRPDV